MAGESRFDHSTLSVSFYAQSFYQLRKEVMPDYLNIYDRVNRREGMDRVELATSEGFLKFTLETAATRMSPVLTVLQKYPNGMPLFSYDAKGKSQVWKRKN